MKIQILSLLFTFLCTSVSGQTVMDKMSHSICKCLKKKEGKVTVEEAKKECFKEVVINNLVEIQNYYKKNFNSDINTDDLANQISVKLLKNCPSAYKTSQIDSFDLSERSKTFPKDPHLNCKDLKLGRYFYVIPQVNSLDTTHVTFTENEYLETFGNGLYSKLSVKWLKDCTFQLTFIESNDPFKKAYSNVGDKYEYQIIRNEPEKIILKMSYNGQFYYPEYFKEK